MPGTNQPNIMITLEGLQMVFVDPKNEKCTVGVLGDVPAGHPFKIRVRKRDDAGNWQPFGNELKGDEIKPDLEIDVRNTSTSGITRRKMDAVIDRASGPSAPPDPDNHDSFKWVVDFEKEIYKKPINRDAMTQGFVSRITLNNGELLARHLSKNKLEIKRGVNGSFEEFGTVATQTGIDIVLDQPNSTAVFKNGDDVIFTADPNSSYEIFVDRACAPVAGGSDADAYHSLYDQRLTPEERIFFRSTEMPPDETEASEVGVPSPPNTPDASCLGASGGSGGGS